MHFANKTRLGSPNNCIHPPIATPPLCPVGCLAKTKKICLNWNSVFAQSRTIAIIFNKLFYSVTK